MLAYQTRIELLSHLLSKPTALIQNEALDLYVEHLDPTKNHAFTKFLEASESEQGEVALFEGQVFRLSPLAHSMTFKLDTTKGRILEKLHDLQVFTREDGFRKAVGNAMKWDGQRFGVKTKFPNFEIAVTAWWNTLKGKEKLIEPKA
jgi:hypothetical protein